MEETERRASRDIDGSERCFCLRGHVSPGRRAGPPRGEVGGPSRKSSHSWFRFDVFTADFAPSTVYGASAPPGHPADCVDQVTVQCPSVPAPAPGRPGGQETHTPHPPGRRSQGAGGGGRASPPKPRSAPGAENPTPQSTMGGDCGSRRRRVRRHREQVVETSVRLGLSHDTAAGSGERVGPRASDV